MMSILISGQPDICTILCFRAQSPETWSELRKRLYWRREHLICLGSGHSYEVSRYLLRTACSTGSRPRVAGPLRTLPSWEKREPWQGQSQLCSKAFQATMQPQVGADCRQFVNMLCSVPNRKWYASQRGATPSSSEVVLFTGFETRSPTRLRAEVQTTQQGASNSPQWKVAAERRVDSGS